MAKPDFVIDCWTDDSGQECEVIDRGCLVALVKDGGESILLSDDDALRVYAALEKWIARRNSSSTVSISESEER